MEGSIGGLPAIALSLQVEEGHHYETAAAFTVHIAQFVLHHGLSAGTLLNVNVPDLPAEAVRGVQITRCGRRIYRDELVRRLDPQDALTTGSAVCRRPASRRRGRTSARWRRATSPLRRCNWT